MRPILLALALLCTAPAVRATDRPAPPPARVAAPEAGALPANYAVDMTVRAEGKDFKMTRWTNENGDVRVDMSMPEHGSMTMITLNDEKKTMYSVMDEQKQVIKQSQASMAHMAAKAPKAKVTDVDSSQGGAATLELVGHEDVNGVHADKYKMTSQGTTGFLWIDPATRLVSRMQADNGTVDFTNYRVGATTPDKLAPPTDYTLTDMDEMMSKMGGMGGMGGAGGMLGGMGKGMLGGMGAGMGGNLGGAAGGALGGMIGGPIGRMAGQYLGNKLGARLGGKVAGGAGSKL